jgi:hypothetical protein
MSFLLSIALLASFAAKASPPALTSAEAKHSIGSAIGQILQGQGTAARSTLEALPEDALNTKDRDFRQCVLSRLSVAEPPVVRGTRQKRIDPFAREVLRRYRTYWRRSAMSGGDRASAEQELLNGLAQLAGQTTFKDLNEAEPIIQVRLKARGLFSQSGQTGVLRDMMIWRRDTLKVHEVPLPEGSYPTRVHYLDKFLSFGWSSYLSCDRAGTGGWTTDEGLFVIVPSYTSLVDENFRINFLAHECQHYSDKKRFGDLPGWRLEFRAKLVELAYADATLGKVLDNFASNQGDDPEDPHSYANKKVLEAIMNRLLLPKDVKLQSVPISHLQRAAINELKADTLTFKALTPNEK